VVISNQIVRRVGLGLLSPLIFACSTCEDPVLTKTNMEARPSGRYTATEKDTSRSWDLQISGDSAVLVVRSGDTTWEVVFDSMDVSQSQASQVREAKCVD